jgi:hypothetical protein
MAFLDPSAFIRTNARCGHSFDESIRRFWLVGRQRGVVRTGQIDATNRLDC